MKRLVAIILLTLHLLNFAGYSLVFRYLIHQSDKEFAQKIDSSSFDRSQLTILKVPIHLPYFTSFGEFERVDGEMIIDGVYYRYVERKVSQDTLYLACLPDFNKTEITQTKDKLAGDLNQSGNNNSEQQGSNIRKMICGSEYIEFSNLLFASELKIVSSFNFMELTPSIRTAYALVPYSPPDQA